MTRELAIITGLVFLVVCVTASDYAGLSFNLTRLANDKFKNPTATGCDWQPENQKFCIDTNSQCLRDCCQCACGYDKSTFDRSTMKCRNNDALRSGCKATFDGKYAGSQIKFLDLSSKGYAKISWLTDSASDKVKSFNVISIAYHDSSAIKTKFLKEKGKPKEKWSRNWEATVEWDEVSKEYHGKLFRVNISYAIERTFRGRKHLLNKNDCFVFKSSGSITVTFPSTTSTTLPPLTTEKSNSTSRRTPSSIDDIYKQSSTNKISTPTVSMTTQVISSTTLPTSVTNQSTKEDKKTPTSITSTAKSPQEDLTETSESGGINSIVIAVTVTLLSLAFVLGLGYLVYYRRRKRYGNTQSKKDCRENQDQNQPPTSEASPVSMNPLQPSNSSQSTQRISHHYEEPFEHHYEDVDETAIAPPKTFTSYNYPSVDI